ncbi:minichromosome maintenance protein MCM [Candidatus Woesearchaeota archaeon]|nr:minichromosome maintenance protein MCM [Candidatus Woesearchaeota archaeon]
MDATTIIRKFQEFLEKNYYATLAEKIRKGQQFIILSFTELSKFDPVLADELLENPEEVIKAGELAIEQFEFDKDVKNFKLRFSNLPLSQSILIRDIRSEHLNKYLSMKGIVRQKSDVRPQVTSARFECPSCGNIITVLQIDSKFKEPSRCGCGRKGKFRLVSKELVDAQKIVLEETPEDLDGGEQPKRLNIFLKSDLVSPITEKRTNPGSKILVNGILKEVPIPAKEGGKLTRFDLMVEANYVEPIEEDFIEIQISEEEKTKIKEIAANPQIYKMLVNSIAPNIFGHEKIKEALILQAMGGVRKVKKTGSITRGDIHILLIGDPGAGKSQLLKRISITVPKARYVSGKGASAAGLTATVVKDDFIRGYALEAGALVLTNRGLCCIDELDKMTREDRSAMHEALEQQTVTISKANIQATLRAETTVLAAANPKFGRFDPYEIIAKQIDLPPTLINRFDLIFPIKDLPDKIQDEKMANFILMLHQNPDTEETDIDTNTLKKYFAYARQNVFPRLSDNAFEEIKNYYVKMRSLGSTEEGGVRTIPISARQLEALVRLAEASARIRLSDKVTKKDAKHAIDLVHFCLSQVGVDPETGKIDIDRISTGISASERSHISIIREILLSIESKTGNNIIPIEDIIIEASSKDINENKVIEAIEKLKRHGDIFEPKRGFIQRI